MSVIFRLFRGPKISQEMANSNAGWKLLVQIMHLIIIKFVAKFGGNGTKTFHFIIRKVVKYEKLRKSHLKTSLHFTTVFNCIR